MLGNKRTDSYCRRIVIQQLALSKKPTVQKQEENPQDEVLSIEPDQKNKSLSVLLVDKSKSLSKAENAKKPRSIRSNSKTAAKIPQAERKASTRSVSRSRTKVPVFSSTNNSSVFFNK